MRVFVVLVINLIVLVQFSVPHTIKPTVITAESEVDEDYDVAKVNQDDDLVPDADLYIDCNVIFTLFIFLK